VDLFTQSQGVQKMMMNQPALKIKPILWAGLLSLLPALFLAGIRAYMGLQWELLEILRDWGIVLGALLAAKFGQPGIDEEHNWLANWHLLSLIGISLLLSVFGFLIKSTGLAALALASWMAIFFLLSDLFSAGLKPLQRGVIAVVMAGIAGVLPLIFAQIQTRFSEEEFFVALQVILMAGYWLLATLGWAALRTLPLFELKTGYQVKRRWVSGVCAAILLLMTVATARAYQTSFYPSQAPGFSGIGASAPYLCGQVQPAAEVYDGKAVFQQLLKQIENNPQKGTPEYGMLAIDEHADSWAKTFHDSLLKEAQQKLFTTPANSVKSVQFDAALRVYYYAKVISTFPAIFSQAEKDLIQDWFNQINSRMQTVEWVDWMYALAYSKNPQGFYENQENGAGLAALLEFEGWANPILSAKNQDYLKNNLRGWQARFRNTDDAFNYQTVWITNALFQSLYTGVTPSANMQLSFDWILLQATPDGSNLHYNQVGDSSIANIAYLGAILMKDPQLAWLAGKNLAYLQKQGVNLFAQPGVEQPIDIKGTSPTEGACLMYGDSGLPNQKGPLAPDKIVFRSGWENDDLYALLDLRFTGWHRYKATNTMSLVYAGQTLTGGSVGGKPFAWLPIGRGQFRDKRIPREYLDGLLVETTGIDGLIGRMTGINPFWSQDPPYYAEVTNFSTDSEVDRSTTVLKDWNGWSQKRTIYFYHSGLMVVADNATGSAGTEGAITWHISGSPDIDGMQIRWSGTPSAEMTLLPLGKGQLEFERDNPEDESGRQTLYYTSKNQIQLVTLFLTKDWVGAQAKIVQDPTGSMLQVESPRQTIHIPLAELLKP
jgi:hypothetical protein